MVTRAWQVLEFGTYSHQGLRSAHLCCRDAFILHIQLFCQQYCRSARIAMPDVNTQLERMLASSFPSSRSHEPSDQAASDRLQLPTSLLLLQTTAAMISMSFVTIMTGFYAMNLRNGLSQPVGYLHSNKVYYAVSALPIAIAYDRNS